MTIFFVSELRRTYGIKQIAGYDELKGEDFDYSEMEQHPVTLYRGRISKETSLRQRKEMLHRPYEENEKKEKCKKIQKQRFTCEEIPALYLATTSYTCWLELGEPAESFYVSAFVPDERGENLRILNLVIVEDMINGFYNASIDKNNIRRRELQNKMISFFPLVIATSYKYIDSHENEADYIIPELVMRSLKKFGIDGVAYLSKHMEHDLQLQIGINIAIPIYKEQVDQGYGIISKYFKMSKPEEYSEKKKELYRKYKSGSYIYDTYYEKNDSYQPHINAEKVTPYGDTVFAAFDNYLVNTELKYYNEE